jgi:mRNA-degrading endonuclease YafQ of YafQ-DinJ toxin-antitoxin module
MRLREFAQPLLSQADIQQLVESANANDWTLLEGDSNVQVLTGKLFAKTLKKLGRDAQVAARLKDFIEFKKENPLQPFGGKDYPLTGKGPIARAFPNMLHAHITSDVSVFYTVEGQHPVELKLYGLFRHDDIGFGNKGSGGGGVQKQKQTAEKFKSQF